MSFWKKKDKGPYPRSFAKRLTRRIMLVQFIVMAIVSAIVVFIGWMIAFTWFGILCDRQIDYRVKSVEKALAEVYVATVNTVPDIENSLQNPDRLQRIMQRMVELNPNIRSCGISFRENYYPKKGRWFCPYAQRRDSDSIVVTQSVGGQQQDYLQQEWFQEALKAKKGYWSKPFFDGQDQKTPLVAYLLPIRDERDSTVAVLGVDLSLNVLAEAAMSGHSIKDGPEKWSPKHDVYFFLIDSAGTYLAHPDMNRVVRKTIFDITKATDDPSDDFVAKGVLADRNEDDANTLTYNELGNGFKLEGEDVVITYQAIRHTSWTLVLAFTHYYIDFGGYVLAGILLFFILLGLLVIFFAGRRGIKKSSKPLKQLAASADEVAKGNFDVRLPNIQSRDEIHQLRDSFDNMQHSLTRYVRELQATTAMKATMESELKIAHDIQMAMLPKIFPPYPERDDIDIYGSLKPARAVGGDLFDFYVHDNQLFFCIGDVSGKGIPASLFMAVTRSLFRNISAHVAQPELIAYALNNALADGNETNMFVTLFTGVLDLATGHLRYCNAGHDAPLLVGRDVGILPCQPNLPLGVMAEYQFEAQETDIDPQTTIFLFTDGLTEAENAVHDQFGDERIHEIATRQLAARQHQTQPFIQKMLEAVRDFVGDAEQSDDLTMLAVQYKPKGIF